jgi:hypothetical protein
MDILSSFRIDYALPLSEIRVVTLESQHMKTITKPDFERLGDKALSEKLKLLTRELSIL